MTVLELLLPQGEPSKPIATLATCPIQRTVARLRRMFAPAH